MLALIAVVLFPMVFAVNFWIFALEFLSERAFLLPSPEELLVISTSLAVSDELLVNAIVLSSPLFNLTSSLSILIVALFAEIELYVNPVNLHSSEFEALISESEELQAAYELILVKANAIATTILLQLFLILPRASSEQATHVWVDSLHLDL
nr:hypothetical protein [Snodgrassella gandavensis]